MGHAVGLSLAPSHRSLFCAYRRSADERFLSPAPPLARSALGASLARVRLPADVEQHARTPACVLLTVRIGVVPGERPESVERCEWLRTSGDITSGDEEEEGR